MLIVRVIKCLYDTNVVNIKVADSRPLNSSKSMGLKQDPQADLTGSHTGTVEANIRNPSHFCKGSASRCYREWGYFRAITISESIALAIADRVSSLEWCRPSSMLAIVDLLMPEASASCSWVMRRSLRRILINEPICWVGFMVISPLRFQIAQMIRLCNCDIEHPLPVDQM